MRERGMCRKRRPHKSWLSPFAILKRPAEKRASRNGDQVACPKAFMRQVGNKLKTKNNKRKQPSNADPYCQGCPFFSGMCFCSGLANNCGVQTIHELTCCMTKPSVGTYWLSHFRGIQITCFDTPVVDVGMKKPKLIKIRVAPSKQSTGPSLTPPAQLLSALPLS